MAKSTIKHHFGGRSGKGSTVPIQILWAGRSPSHRQLPYTVDGHGWHGCCHAGSRPAGGAGVRWTGGGATRESVPSVEGLQRKLQDGSKSNMGGSAVGFFPGAKERVSWCITFIELGSLAEGAHIGSYQMHPFQTLV